MNIVIVGGPEILGSIAGLSGTRVPVKNLFDFFEKGYTVQKFLENFSEVTERQVLVLVHRNNANKI